MSAKYTPVTFDDFVLECLHYNVNIYNTNVLSLCREICFLARHLHENIQ